MVGDYLFPRIKTRHGDEYAGKLTGMILGLDPEELFTLVKDESLLNSRSDEAKRVLEAHGGSA